MLVEVADTPHKQVQSTISSAIVGPLSHNWRRQYRPRQKNRPLFEYDASHINGNGASILDEVEDCLVGTETSYSWISESPDSTVTTRGQQWHTIIEQGVQQTDAVERGHDCYVFRQEFPVDGGVIANEVYVDKQTFLVIRWDGFQPGI